MPLAAGTRLAQYEIEGSLGAGGMGEVYRARDTKLGRIVAIKVLPAALADDPDRIARFEREARALAALNHPHIATLFGLETSTHEDHRLLLVMELVEGEGLDERLRLGPLPLETALACAIQIADALEAAHEKGIVHRDLKPGNIRITPDQQVKVLDFGLARAFDDRPPGGAASGSLANSPTLSALGHPGTQAGIILGTAAYMSPEQARGLPVDHRSDIFSFGIVLFEMLTGRQPFQGETLSDILASVLAREADLGALQPSLNPRLPDLIRRCLDKSPKRRWQAIGDVRAELEVIAAAPRVLPAEGAPIVAGPPTPVWRRGAPFVAVALVTSALTWAAASMTKRPAQPPTVARFTIPLDPLLSLTSNSRHIIDISRDGQMLTFSAGALFVRPISEIDARPVTGSETSSPAIAPVFSPDGQSIAFWTTVDGTIKRISVGGGRPVTICPSDSPLVGISWTDDGIVFANANGIYRVSPAPGKPEQLVPIARTETALRPQVLPGGRAVLFTVAPSAGTGEKWDAARIVAQILPSGERKTIVEGATDGRYVPTGHLLFARGGIVLAARFDVERLALTGPEVAVIEGVRRGTGVAGSGFANVAISDNGTLIYLPGPTGARSNVLYAALFDRAGFGTPVAVPPGPYKEPRISPDGAHIAFESDDGKDANVWVLDVGTEKAARRLTFGGHNRTPVWSADSQRVTFQSDRNGATAIYWQRTDGTGVPERLTTAEKDVVERPLSWSRSGDRLLVESTKGAVTSLWVFSPRDGRMTPIPGVESTELTGAVFSSDGQWIAYATRPADGRTQVYVEPFPPAGTKYQVSNATEDAHHPVWSADGTELFYTPGPGTRLVRVPISTRPSFSFGAPSIIERPFANGPGTDGRPYDVMPDGKHFLGLSNVEVSATRGRTPAQINVVLNWFEELKARTAKR